MRFITLSLSASLLILSGCTIKRSVVYPEKNIKVTTHQPRKLGQSQKKAYLAAVNAMRSRGRFCGTMHYYPAAQPLRWSDELYRAAYEHSLDMGRSRQFSHEGSGKDSDRTAALNHPGKRSLLAERIKANSYKKRKFIGENIAYGHYSLDTLMRKWIDSKGHCGNIMNPKFTDFAMARVSTGGRIDYWTQVFASSYE